MSARYICDICTVEVADNAVMRLTSLRYKISPVEPHHTLDLCPQHATELLEWLAEMRAAKGHRP